MPERISGHNWLMVSVRAKAVTASLRARRSKKFYTNPHEMRDRLSHHQNPRRTVPPRFVRRSIRVEHETVDGYPCYLLSPKEPRHRNPARILHIHGGGFVEQPERHHWRFVSHIVHTTGATVIFPMYPMAPERSHSSIQQMVRRSYDRLVGPSADEDRIVFGDSAGGGLALWLVAQLHAESGPVPAAVALFSPWLNLATDDPLSTTIDPRDPELGKAGLQLAGKWYAGTDSPSDPQLSTLYLNFSDFPSMAVFTGTCDILLPDAMHLRDRARSVGVDVDYNEFGGMFHNWIMHRIPEGRSARKELDRFLRTRTEVHA